MKLLGHVGVYLTNGLLKGILICGVVVFALMVFPVNKRVLVESQIAPYCVFVTRAVVGLIPQELKDKFKEVYQDIKKGVKKDEGEV